MRIGIDIRELENGKSTGIGRYLRHFLLFANEFDKDNKYVLFGNNKTCFSLMNENQELHIIPGSMTVIWDQILLPKAIKKEKIDVFLSPYFKAPGFCPCKMVVIINDLIPLMVPEYKAAKYFFKRIYFKMLTRFACRSADKIITISSHTKNDLIKIFHLPGEKIKVVYLAVELAYKKIENPDSCIFQKYKVGQKFILHVGHFKPHKNIGRLIEAYNKLPESLRGEYKLVLLAKKDLLYYELYEQAQKLGLEDNVIFTDHVPEEELPYFYNAASLLVVPSLYEGFGLPALEAMACGTPVVVSRAASLPEVVGEAAICFDPCNVDEITQAMERVLNDENLKSDLIENGFKRSGEFTIEKMGAKIREILIHS